jgi:hypothetical protein
MAAAASSSTSAGVRASAAGGSFGVGAGAGAGGAQEKNREQPAKSSSSSAPLKIAANQATAACGAAAALSNVAGRFTPRTKPVVSPTLSPVSGPTNALGAAPSTTSPRLPAATTSSRLNQSIETDANNQSNALSPRPMADEKKSPAVSPVKSPDSVKAPSADEKADGDESDDDPIDDLLFKERSEIQNWANRPEDRLVYTSHLLVHLANLHYRSVFFYRCVMCVYMCVYVCVCDILAVSLGVR